MPETKAIWIESRMIPLWRTPRNHWLTMQPEDQSPPDVYISEHHIVRLVQFEKEGFEIHLTGGAKEHVNGLAENFVKELRP